MFVLSVCALIWLVCAITWWPSRHEDLPPTDWRQLARAGFFLGVIVVPAVALYAGALSAGLAYPAVLGAAPGLMFGLLALRLLHR